jgi:hypothetical protein
MANKNIWADLQNRSDYFLYRRQHDFIPKQDKGVEETKTYYLKTEISLNPPTLSKYLGYRVGKGCIILGRG